MFVITYFRRKTHLQLVEEFDWVTAPPNIGPNNNEKPYATEIPLVNAAYFSGGTSSVSIT